MRSTIRSRFARLVCIAVLAMSVIVAGCGTDEDGRVDDYAGRIRKERSPAKPVVQPPVDRTPAPVEPAQPVVAEPEPPREVTYEEAEAAYHARRYDEAVELFTEYTERKSENPWGYYMLGLSSWKAGHYEDAEEAFGRALEIDPRHVKSYVNLARVLLDAGRPAEALAKIESALDIDPDLDVAHRLKGRVSHQLGQPDEAIDAYRQAIRIDNNDAWSMNNMGLILIEQGRFDEALPPLARAVELKDDVAVFRNNLGMALEHAGQIRAAEDAYTAAARIDETYSKAIVNMVRIGEVREDPGIEPVDLAAVAQRFVEEIARWAYVPTDTMPPETIAEEPDEAEPDSIVIGDAGITAVDSIGSNQR